MSQPWLLLAFSWIGPVSLQYIETGALDADAPLDLTDTGLQYPQYFNRPPSFDTFQNDMAVNYQQVPEATRKRRTANDPDSDTITWRPNLVDTDNTVYFKSDIHSPFLVGYNENNQTEVEKKNFSPWGGKRGRPHASFEHMWSWKRSLGIREPSMPKRVRFSPWGGKRSGQMIYKPGAKASKIIFFSSIPELRRIVSSYSPKSGNTDFIPGMDKRHPIRILALSGSHLDVDRTLRDALPFSSSMDSAPKLFKPGHPYNEVHLKKDGKRKMKFSIWGGKRSPPIIGPIWTPASENVQDSALHTILLYRNMPKVEQLNAL